MAASFSSASSDDLRRGDREEAEREDGDGDEDDDADRLGNPVDRVVGHPPEDLAAEADRLDDHREAGREQDDVGGGTGGVGRAGNRDPGVGAPQGGGVVDAVAGHRDDVPGLLERLDDPVLVLGHDLREAVGGLDPSPPAGRRSAASAPAVEDPVSEADLACDLPGDLDPVAGDHLDASPSAPASASVAARVVPGRVVQRQHAEQPPVLAVAVAASDGERTEAARRRTRRPPLPSHFRLFRPPASAAIACGAPLATSNIDPSPPRTRASARLRSGSNGPNSTVL